MKRLTDNDDVLPISFCEMVKNPALYFDKKLRLSAMISSTVDGGCYLTDEKCLLTHDEQIGVGYAGEIKAINAALQKIRSTEYDYRAMVQVVGILRNAARRDFAWYHYRFDVLKFESIAPVVVPYEGSLQIGTTYQADIHPDFSFVVPLKLLEHHAVRIEWTNRNKFRQQKSPAQLVFSVLSDDIKQMTERRWNRTIRCRILSVTPKPS
jgi:hypothetical protein